MNLKPIRSVPSMKLAGRVAGDLHAALSAYGTYYRETTGQTIVLWSLAVRIVRQFMNTDRDFEAWLRRIRNGHAGGPAAS